MLYRQYLGYLWVALVILTAIFGSINAAAHLAEWMIITFLLKEMVVKQQHYWEHDQFMPKHFLFKKWEGAAAEGRTPSMGIVKISAHSGRQFSLRLGIHVEITTLGISTFWTYGRITSRPDGVAVIRTWLGKNPGIFTYMCSLPAAEIEINWSEGVQNLEPQRTDWPHWYQQWPLYLWG